MAERITWSDDDLIDGRQRSGAGGQRGGANGGGQRRLPLPAVIVAGLVAAVAVGSGVTWLLMSSGESGGTASAPPLIRADEKPIKVYPESPGGMNVDNADKLVYSRLRGETHKGEVERILPEPERPQKPEPLELPTPSSSAPAALPSGRSASDGAEADERAGVSSGPTQLAPGADEAEEQPVEAAPPPKPAPAPKAAEAKPTQVAQAKPVPTPPPAPKATPKPEPTQKPATTPAPATGRFQVQLLAARSAEDAQGAWKKIQAKNSDVLGGLSSSVAKADLGDRGIFYRLRVGPLASEAKAQSLCSALSSRNVSCLIIRPGR